MSRSYIVAGRRGVVLVDVRGEQLTELKLL